MAKPNGTGQNALVRSIQQQQQQQQQNKKNKTKKQNKTKNAQFGNIFSIYQFVNCC